MTASAPRIVILGGGQAGGWAAKTLRDHGHTGPLTLVADEPHPPYERPPLSKAVLSGAAEPARTHLFTGDLFAGLGIDWRRGRRATLLDRALRHVVLDDGDTIPYDRLLLATGGRARPLALATDVPVHTLRTLDDALGLRERLRAGGRLLVVGGGWIGLEVASTARAAGLAVHVVEAASCLCARVLPATLAQHVQALHERHGVAFSLGATLVRLERRGEGARALLADGTVIDAQCVVAGIGMLANDDLARSAGLRCNNGIVVDARCATSDPAIFAAGDVAVTTTRWSAQPLRLESWQNAQDQGIAAARAMLDLDVHYDPLPRFWSDQHGVNLQLVGLPSSDDTPVVRGNLGLGPALAFMLRDNVVRAVVGFDAGRDMRIARGFVEKAAQVDSLRLADPAVSLAQAVLPPA